MKDWEKEYDAPEGKEWMCGACGRHGNNRLRIGDESCFLNAVLVDEVISTEGAGKGER